MSSLGFQGLGAREERTEIEMDMMGAGQEAAGRGIGKHEGKQGGEAPTERQGKWGHGTVRGAQGVMREKEAKAQEE